MNMAMYNKFITFLVLMFIVSYSYAQQYTPMTAAGYQYKRAKVDSTLHIPSFCGVPTLRNSTAIQGAIAMDTCANKLYQWTNAAGWSTISTNAIDSLKRSNDSIFARKSGVWVFQYKDSVGGGGSTPSLQDVATVGNYYANDYADTLRLNSYDGNNKHPILWTNDQYGGTPNNILDFSYNPVSYENVAKIKFGDNSSTLGNGYIEITDKESIFKNEISTRTIIQNGYNSSANNQTTYFPLMKGGTDTLATTFDIRNSAIDTANKFVNNVVKKNDSTITVYKGSTATDITLTPSTTVASATRLVTTVYNNSGATITKGSVIYINGRHSSNLPTIALAQANTENNSYATFALVQDDITNNNSGTIIQAGNISNLNLPTASFADGEVVYLSPTVAGGLTTNKTSVLAPNHIVKLGTITRAHPTFGSIEIRIENGWQLDELSDVQIPIVPNDSTLLQFSRVDSLWHSVGVTNAIGTKYIKPSDTVSLSNRINLKVNIADTATMLSKYLRNTDTASLSSRINLKVNISDTASMLTPYLRSNTASATYLAKSDSTTYYTKYRSDTSRTNIYNALLGKQGTITLTTTGTSGASTLVGNTLNIPQYSGGTSYTFSTGLTNSSGTVTNNLSTGVSGGQSVVGGTDASNSLTLSSTSNATKGKILFGTSAYDEVNNRLGIGTASPATTVNVIGSTGYNALRIGDGTGYINQQYNRGATGSWLTQTTTASTGIMFEYSHATNPGFNFLVPGTVAMGLGMDNAGMFMSNTTSSYPGTTLMKIFNGGNTAIGTSTNAGYKLDVNGTARASTSIESPIHYGNSTASGTLTLGSTSNATKGKLLFGTSAYDEVNNRLGIGLTSPTTQLDVLGTAKISTTDNSYNQQLVVENKSTGTTALTGIVLQAGASSSLVGQMTYVPANYITASLQNTLLFSSAGQQKLAFVANGSGSGGVAQDMYFSTLGTNSTYQMQIKGSTGNVQIGTNTDAGYKLDVNGTARANQFQLSALNTAPATSSSTGTTGEIRIVNGFIYVCVATNTWQRATLSTF